MCMNISCNCLYMLPVHSLMLQPCHINMPVCSLTFNPPPPPPPHKADHGHKCIWLQGCIHRLKCGRRLQLLQFTGSCTASLRYVATCVYIGTCKPRGKKTGDGARSQPSLPPHSSNVRQEMMQTISVL